jgi:hypothetical protein
MQVQVNFRPTFGTPCYMRPPAGDTAGETERMVAKLIRRELERRQWRIVRNNVTKIQFRPGAWTQFGEPGMPDLLAIQYLRNDGLAVVLWVETKREYGGRLGDAQITWRDQEKRRGATVIVTSDPGKFLRDYEELLGWIHRPPYSIPGHQATFEQSFGD